MEFQTLIDAFSQFGISGTIAVFVIFLAIFAGKKFGLVVNGNQARFANVVLAAILTGLSNDPNAETALQTVIVSLAASLLHTLLEYLGNKAKPFAG